MRNLVASTLVPTATQETATAKNAQNQSFPNRTSGKDLLKTFSKQKLASKTKFVKQYMTHRKRYLCNRSTRFCQTLIKKGSQYPKQQRYVAKHHDTKAASSLKYGQKLKIATLNCRGLAALSKRQQLTYIMQQHNIDIMAVQETKQAFSPTESHKGYAFFFSGKQANRGPAHYGVGFVISPQIKHCILDCVPVNDRWNWKFQQKDVGTTLWIYMLRTVADRMMKKNNFWDLLNHQCEAHAGSTHASSLGIWKQEFMADKFLNLTSWGTTLLGAALDMYKRCQETN